MTTSVKRTGLGALDDPELETRLRRIEEELAQRQLANLDVTTGAIKRSTSTVTSVTGIRVDNEVVGGLGITWNPADIADLRRYEINIAATADFGSNVQEYRTTAPRFLSSGLSANQTYYVRVRAVNSRGEAGPWSGILNTSTKQATFTNLAAGAASNITVFSQVGGFNPEVLLAGEEGEYLNEDLSMPTTAEVLIFGFAKTGFDTIAGNDTGAIVELLVDGDSKQIYDNTTTAGSIGVLSTGTLSIPGLAFPLLLGAGVHRFSFRVAAGNNMTLTPVEFIVAIWESRN